MQQHNGNTDGIPRIWSPTITAGGGTLTTVSAQNPRWTRIGAYVKFSLVINLADEGTGTTSLNFTLPTTCRFREAIYGYDTATGLTLMGTVGNNSNTVAMVRYNATDPLNNSTFYVISGMYESAD